MQFVGQRDLHGAAIVAEGGFDFEDGADRTCREGELRLAFGIGAKGGEMSVFANGFVGGAGAGFSFDEEGVDESGLTPGDGGFHSGQHGGIIR